MVLCPKPRWGFPSPDPYLLRTPPYTYNVSLKDSTSHPLLPPCIYKNITGTGRLLSLRSSALRGAYVINIVFFPLLQRYKLLSKPPNYFRKKCIYLLFSPSYRGFLPNKHSLWRAYVINTFICHFSRLKLNILNLGECVEFIYPDITCCQK